MKMAYLWLVFSAACSVAASVTLKSAGAQSPDALSAPLATQAWLYLAAIGAYGLGFGLYALALRQIDLTVAYPLMVACAIGGVFLYGLLSGAESISGMRMAGAAFIAVGVFLISK